LTALPTLIQASTATRRYQLTANESNVLFDDKGNSEKACKKKSVTCTIIKKSLFFESLIFSKAKTNPSRVLNIWTGKMKITIAGILAIFLITLRVPAYSIEIAEQISYESIHILTELIDGLTDVGFFEVLEKWAGDMTNTVKSVSESDNIGLDVK
jgi:hypothetical protein